MTERVLQRHREAAADRIGGGCEKAARVRESILAGRSDDHPSVQAAAFYENRSRQG